MLKKVGSTAFWVVLIGYVLALNVMAISTWLTDPPRWPADALVRQPPKNGVIIDIVIMGSNGPVTPQGNTSTTNYDIVGVSWRCSRRVLNQYNSEYVSRSTAVLRN